MDFFSSGGVFGGGGGGVRIFLLFFLVGIMFPMCSHEVPHNVPNSTSVLSHMICPKFNSHLYKFIRWAIGSTFIPILQLVVQIGFHLGSAQMFQKHFVFSCLILVLYSPIEFSNKLPNN
jgi:uncharacterized membrane protein YfcA